MFIYVYIRYVYIYIYIYNDKLTCRWWYHPTEKCGFAFLQQPPRLFHNIWMTLASKLEGSNIKVPIYVSLPSWSFHAKSAAIEAHISSGWCSLIHAACAMLTFGEVGLDVGRRLVLQDFRKGRRMYVGMLHQTKHSELHVTMYATPSARPGLPAPNSTSSMWRSHEPQPKNEHAAFFYMITNRDGLQIEEHLLQPFEMTPQESEVDGFLRILLPGWPAGHHLS